MSAQSGAVPDYSRQALVNLLLKGRGHIYYKNRSISDLCFILVLENRLHKDIDFYYLSYDLQSTSKRFDSIERVRFKTRNDILFDIDNRK